jgi:hypothetical protein
LKEDFRKKYLEASLYKKAMRFKTKKKEGGQATGKGGVNKPPLKFRAMPQWKEAT